MDSSCTMPTFSTTMPVTFPCVMVAEPPPAVGRGEKPMPQNTCAFVGENVERPIISVDNNGDPIDAGTDLLRFVAKNLDAVVIQSTLLETPQDPTTKVIAIPTMSPGVNDIIGQYNWIVESTISKRVVAYGSHETQSTAVIGDQANGLSCVTVKDGQTPLQNAVVVVLQDGKVLESGVTNSDGRVFFDLKPGKYDLQVIHSGKITKGTLDV